MTRDPGPDRDDDADAERHFDDDLAFLRAMQSMGTQRKRPPPQARRPVRERPVEELPPDETEDALFEAAMRRMEAGLPAAEPRQAPVAPEPAAATEEVAPEPSEAPTAPAPPKNPLFHGSERSLRRRLKKGEIEPQAEIDLHRMRKGEALNALAAFLQCSQEVGHGLVLVITGKGRHSADLGVLREMVPVLLASRWPDRVRQTVPAPPRLGGEGAFAVFLRT